MKTHTITLTSEDLQAINAGLQELPMKIAAPIVIKINRQLEQSQNSPDMLSETQDPLDGM